MLDKEFKVYDRELHQFIQIPLCEIFEPYNQNTIYNQVDSRFILLQCVGMKDISNVKIFEYDIVETYYQDGSIRQVFYVHWIKKDCRFNVSEDLVKFRYLKVVGNVFTTPWILPNRYLLLAEADLGFGLVERRILKEVI